MLTNSQLAARAEIQEMIETLKLPLRVNGLSHIAARHDWFDRMTRFYADQGSGPGAP